MVSGSEYFLKKQALMEIKKRFFSEGGVEQGLIEFNGKDTDRNPAGNLTGSNNLTKAGPSPDKQRRGLSPDKQRRGLSPDKQRRGLSTLFKDVIDEVKTIPMFGKHKLIIVENADTFLVRDQDKVLGYLKNPCSVNCLVLEVLSVDKRTKLAKAMDGKQGILIECDKLYDRPAPWETRKPEHDSELTRWIVVHAGNFGKTINLKSAFCLLEKTGNNLSIIDNQIDALSVYIGDRKEITIEDIQNLLGVSHREKLYNLLDAIGMKDTISAVKMAENILDIGMENEHKNITYDAKSIAITIVSSSHRRMKDLWKILRILDKGGSKKEILEKQYAPRPFVDKFIKQAQNFNEEEMPEKWKYMLEADLLCKTSRLSPTLIIEQLITRLCN
jgi:DNA polymerase-3 subunit delta